MLFQFYISLSFLFYSLYFINYVFFFLCFIIFEPEHDSRKWVSYVLICTFSGISNVRNVLDRELHHVYEEVQQLDIRLTSKYQVFV